MIRIIAGKHRGRRLETREGKQIRPTLGRARESLFNILTHGAFGSPDDSPILERNIADLFCGTGAFGLEALSRGATHVVFVDQDPASLNLARRNAETLKEHHNANFLRMDSAQLAPAHHPCHLVFLDPPYGKQLVLPTLKNLAAKGWLQDGSIVVAEHDAQEVLEPLPKGYELFDSRDYGRTIMSLLRWAQNA